MDFLKSILTSFLSENPTSSQPEEQPVEIKAEPTEPAVANDEDEYKRRIAEQKRLHQLKKQQEEEERLKKIQEAEEREAERKEQEKKAKLEALDAKVEVSSLSSSMESSSDDDSFDAY